MDGRAFRLSPLAYGKASRRTPFLLRALWATQGDVCNAIWPEQFAPLRLVRNLSQLIFSDSHLGTKYSLLGLGRSLGLGGEKDRRHVVDILGRTA